MALASMRPRLFSGERTMLLLTQVPLCDSFNEAPLIQRGKEAERKAEREEAERLQ